MCPCITTEELRDYLMFQMGKFHDWVWSMGMDTGINMRDFFSDDELVTIFIGRYAQDLRKEFYSK